MGLVNADVWYGAERRRLRHPRIRHLVIRGWFVQLHFRNHLRDQDRPSPLHGPFPRPSDAEKFIQKRFGQKSKNIAVRSHATA